MGTDSGMPSPPRLPLPTPPGKMHTTQGGARIAKEGPMPGYSGTIPAYRNHVIGHGYTDASRRAVALTDSMRHNKIENAYHLVWPPPASPIPPSPRTPNTKLFSHRWPW